MSSVGEAIGRADAGANPIWKATALEIVKSLAEKNAYLDTDMVFNELDRRGIDTHERRAMGPVMLRAVKSKWVRLQDCNHCGTSKVIKQSTRDESHGKDTAVYKSLIKS